jgi:hypothetical protein
VTSPHQERRREEIEAIIEQWYDRGLAGKAVLISEISEYLHIEIEGAYIRGLRAAYLREGLRRRLDPGG